MPSLNVPSSGGSFRIDLDQAPQAIKELEAARDELKSIRDQALYLGRVDPGSRDSVSIDAAARLSAVAVSGPTSLVAALDVGLRHIEQLITSMSTDIRDHHNTESENASTFRS